MDSNTNSGRLTIHFIAIGGEVMHNLALAMHDQWHRVTGSDDEIYEPSRSRLDQAGLLPDQMGWNPDRITADIDVVVLGMHAKKDNPELLRAQELGLKIMSFPEFVYEQSKSKKRVVIAGSHGKTTTTSMVVHALQFHNKEIDYVVGAQLAGLDRMVKLTNAPVIIIEGDEYLSSAIDRRPKMLLYQADIAVVTGIAWDHINVFPTFDSYVEQFKLLLEGIPESGKVFYYEEDFDLVELIKAQSSLRSIPYSQVEINENNEVQLGHWAYEMKVFGAHNFQNMKAAQRICNELGLSAKQFFTAMESFVGADKRLQFIKNKKDRAVIVDYAHAPSKVAATVSAMKDQYQHRKLIAALELHTFSSLNKDFIPQYKHAMDDADLAIIYYSNHTLKMKGMPEIDPEWLAEQIPHPKLKVFNEKSDLVDYLQKQNYKNCNLLLMSSGTFDGLDLVKDSIKI